MNVELLVEQEFTGETRLRENVTNALFFHMTWPGIETGSPQWEACD
jgi:hypothetical protein